MEKRKTTITGKRLLSLLLIAAVVITLSPHLPGVEGEALAASASTLYITDSVGGESQTVTGSSSGTGWNWDAGTATLTLSRFDGSYIEANGDVKIILDGTNRITPANDAQYVIKADGVITIEKTSNDETDKLIIENNAMTSSSFRAIYGSISGGYKDTVINGGTVEIKIKNENSSTIYGGYYIYLYGSSNLKIDIDGYNVIGATGIYVNDSADVNVSVNAQTYATGTDHFSALGSGNVTMTATINGDYAHANAKAFDLDAGYEFKGMKLQPGGRVTAKGRISQWRDYNVQAIDDTVKTTPEARILKKETSSSNYLIYHDESGNPITYMTFEGTDTLQPMRFTNPGGLFNIPESEVGTRIDTIYLMSGLSSRNATFSLKDGSILPDGIILSSSGRISGTPTTPAEAGTVTIVATRADTEPIEFEISYGEVKVKPTYITINADKYNMKNNANGTGWNWDAGTATLTLSRFDGSYIEADGDVKIILDGTNRITPANDAQYVIKADGVITIEKTSNDETDKLIIGNNAMTSSSFRAIYGSSSGVYKDTVINGGTVEIKIKNENSSTIYGGYYIYLYGSSNLKIDIDGYNVIGATGIYVNDSADVNVSVNAQTYATGTDHFSALGSGNVTMTATINGDYTHANAKAFDLDAGFSGKGMKLKQGGKVTANGRISQWYSYDVQAIDDTVKTTPEARILKKETSSSNYLIYHDESGNPITYMTFEGTDTLQPMRFTNPGGLFNIPESEVGTSIAPIYLMSGLSSRNATLSLKDGSILPDGIILSSSGRISGTPTTPAEAGTVTIVATRADTEPIEFEISYGEVKVKQPVTGVTLSQTELILNRYDSETLTAAVLPEDASIRTVSWNSSRSDIASVNSTYSGSETATVRGLSVGKATITVTTTQGNKQATCTVYVRENKPNAAVDYVNERLTGLISGAKYEISGSGITTYSFTATETYCEIDENWFGKNISIVRVNDTEINCNSEAQTIDIPGRPDAPTLTTQEESCEGAGDGKISGVDTTMQYRKTGETNWKSCTGSEITNLATGSYEVRVKAIAGTQFAGKTTKVTIGTKAFTFEKPTDIPAGNTTTWIDSLNLSSYVSGGKMPYTYTIVSGPAWITLKGSTISGQRPASPTAAGGQEEDLVLKVSDANSQELTQTIKVGDVTQKPQDAPDKPVQSGEAGTNSITIQTISGQLYACVPATEENAPNLGEAAWITPDGSGTHTFTGLTHNTEYKIYAMKPAQGEYSASAASDPLLVTTKEAFTKTPVPSKASCGFKDPFTLTATSEEGATIYYTIDSTEPSNGDTKDKFPESGITIGNSSDPVGTIYTVKLKAFMDDGSKSPSETITLTYTKVDGYTVSGTVKGYNSSNAPVVSLYDAADTGHTTPIATAVVDAAVASGGQYTWNFSFAAVTDGTYDLVVTKAGHLKYTITGVKVEGADIDLTSAAFDGKAYQMITLLAGDMNGDGKINNTDLLVVRKNLGKSNENILDIIADITGDNKVNNTDLLRLRANLGRTAKNNSTMIF